MTDHLAAARRRLRKAPLSNHVPVSGPSDTNGRPDLPQEDAGVLGGLPRTRPQRASARRAAARAGGARAAAGPSEASPNGAAPERAPAKAKTPASRPAKRSPAKKRAATPRSGPATTRTRRQAEPVPRQGFATEDDLAVGEVQPPGGAELLNTAAEIVSELAKAGVSGGERLLRGIFSRLPG